MTGNHAGAQVVVEGERAQQLRGDFEIFRRELDAGAAEGVGDRRRGVREHRHVGGHRFDQRHAEPFVLAERHVHGCVLVVDREFLVGDGPGEDEPIVQQSEL